MEGRGRFMATVFARRFLTHEDISLEGDADGRAAQDGILAFAAKLHGEMTVTRSLAKAIAHEPSGFVR